MKKEKARKSIGLVITLALAVMFMLLSNARKNHRSKKEMRDTPGSTYMIDKE